MHKLIDISNVKKYRWNGICN